MLGHEDSQVLVTSFETIHFQRSTLSAKVIKLRKRSQENHVRRMKIAQQKKGFQTPQNNSLCLPVVIKKSSISKTPFTVAADIKSNIDSEQYNRMGTGETFRANVYYDNATPRIKYSEVDSDDNQAVFGKCRSQSVKCSFVSDSSKYNSHHMELSGQGSSDIKGGATYIIRPSDVMERERSSFPKAENIHSVPDSAKCNIKTHKNVTKSVNTVSDSEIKTISSVITQNKGKVKNKVSNPLNEERLKNHLLVQKKCFSRSRIPVLSSRLVAKGEDEKNVPFLFKSPDKSRKSNIKNAKKSNDGEMPPSMLKEKNLNAEEGILENVPIKQMEKLTIQETYKMPVIRNNFSLDLINISSGKLRSSGDHKDAHPTDMSPSKLSNISKWLNSIIDTSDRKNSSGSQLISCENKSTSSQDKSSRPTLGSEKTLKPENASKDSGISNKPSSANSDSGDSSESYYDTEEAEDILMDHNKACDTPKWEEDFDVGSTITLPSDKELDLEHHRENVFRNLPDYPNTPYNLRYPRYRTWEKHFRSVDIETETDSNRRKVLKNPKKSFHTTPKRRKSSKIRRNLKSKKTASRKKETVD